MAALTEDTKFLPPSLEEASPSLISAFMHLSDSKTLIDDVCQVNPLHHCALPKFRHLQCLKNVGDLVAECTAEYRRNVSHIQDLMCNVPLLQDAIYKEKLVEACTTEDCGNASGLQGPMYDPNEVQLVCDASDLPHLVELLEQCDTENCGKSCGLQGTIEACGNACGLQGTINRRIKQDVVECAAEDRSNSWHLQHLMDNANVHDKAADLQGTKFMDSCGMVNLHKVKQMEELSREESSSVSNFQGVMFNLSNVDSAKESAPKDCNNVSDLQHKVHMAEDCREEYRGPALDLPSLMSILREMKHAEGCPAENHGDISGLLKNVMGKEHEVEPKAELRVVLQGSKQLPAYLLAEVVMNMSTVAVFLTQHAPSLADNKRDDAKVHAVPVDTNASSSADNQRGDMSQKAASVKANTCLLASTVVPYIKLFAEQYKRSRGSDLRGALHEAKMIEYRGYGPDPAPDWMPCHVSEMLSQYGYLGYKEGSFNPLFERIWLPWARSAEFYHHQDVAMICDQETLCRGLHYKTLASLCLSWAIPTRPVLEYMIAMAPQGKIAEIGSGLGYWAALLKKLGADIITVDDFSERSIPSALYFPETIPIDGETFVRQGGAHGRALFFCWPLKSWNQKFSMGTTYKQMYQTCLAEACLDAFHGDTVFFVGEKDDGCTFDMAAWMQRSPKHRRTWRLEKEIDIPSWPGVHDVFMCFVKHKEEIKHSSGKKKKKAARKAQQVEDAQFFQLEKSAKEEDFLKASFAAYPNCSMQ